MAKKKMQVLDKKEIESRLQRLEEWIFQDFSEAMDFLNMVAVIVEKHNHYPEIHNVYNKVTLWLSTHDAGGITEKDIKIAQEINKIRLDFYYFYRFSSNLNIS